MKTLTKTILTSATALALIGTPVFADTNVTADTDMSAQVENGVSADADANVNVDSSVGSDIKTAAENTADKTGDAMKKTGDAVSDTASKTWDATKNGAATAMNGVATFGDEVVSEIVGTDVVSVNGNDVGEIDAIVKESGSLKAVVGIGGFLGIAEHDVLIDIDQFAQVDDDTVMIKGQTEEELKALPDVDQSELVKVEGDMTLTQAMNS